MASYFFTNLSSDVFRARRLFYRAYVDQKINWNTFCKLNEINRRMFTNDYDVLLNFKLFEEAEIQNVTRYRVDRLASLASLGLLQPMEGKQTWGDVLDGTTNYQFLLLEKYFFNMDIVQ